MSHEDPAVHRRLHTGIADSEDVRALQRGVNLKAAHFKLDQFTVKVDGDLGIKTAIAGEQLLYAIGCVGKPMRLARKGEFSEYAQRLLRGTRNRTDDMKVAALKRRAKVRRWRKEGNSLGERAYREALKLIGVMEEGGNNTGAMVDKIILSNGGAIGEPWCGDGMAYCYRLAGSKAVQRLWASVRALFGLFGIKQVSTPRRGDLVRFTFDHVGMFVRDLHNGEIETIECNTGASGAVSDSTTGGDGVYRKRRSKSLVNDYLRVTR